MVDLVNAAASGGVEPAVLAEAHACREAWCVSFRRGLPVVFQGAKQFHVYLYWELGVIAEGQR